MTVIIIYFAFYSSEYGSVKVIYVLSTVIFISSFALSDEISGYTRRYYQSITFSPKGESFEFFLGPKGRLMLIGKECSQLIQLQTNLSLWKRNIGEEENLLQKCTCGKKNTPKVTFEFFKNILKKRKGVNPNKEPFELFRFKKKMQIKEIEKSVGQFCYLDIDGILPLKAEKMAKEQITLDTLNMFDNNQYETDGINCYNTALNSNGIIDSLRHVSPFEMSLYLTPPVCDVVKPSERRPGDLLVYYESKRLEQNDIDPHIEAGKSIEDVYRFISETHPLHTSIYIDNKFVFEKKGGSVGFPVQLANATESLKLNQHVKKESVINISYRCKNNREIKEIAKKYPEVFAFYNQVQEYEKCFEEFYLSNDFSVRRKIYKMLQDNGSFMILNKLIGAEIKKYSIIEDGVTVGYDPEYLEKVTLLKLIERKLHTMIDDRRGRGHDGPKYFYDHEKGKYLWE